MKREQTAHSLYERLVPDREPYLSRARKFAEMTIPHLLPPQRSSNTSALYTPYQSVGARGVNNLASKLLLAILPPNSPFFRLLVDDYELAEGYDENKRAEFEEALGDVERSVMTEIERKALRTPVFSALKQIITLGNSLLFFPKNGHPRAIRMDSYVVRRSPDGTVLDIIINEEIAYAALPKNIRDQLDDQPDAKERNAEDVVQVYTHVYLDGGKYRDYQEVEGITVEGSEGSYDRDASPYLPLRWVPSDGEHYGRSHVEEYFGDLNSLEGLSQSIVECSLASAKAVILLHPNATTRADKLTSARNLDVIQGNADDVDVLQLDKRADLQVAASKAQEITQLLSQVFLMNSSVQRNAERVTAEEIRYMAAELEDALGGVYSLLSQEFQLPLVNRLMSMMQREGRLPKLPPGIEPSIVTGLEALGRGHDLSKYQILSNEMAKFGPDAVDEYLNLTDYFTRFSTGLGLDSDGLIRSEDEREERAKKRAEQIQQQQALELVGRAAGPAISAAAKQGNT